MPDIPLRSCAQPGCPEFAVVRGRCLAHARPNAAARGYDGLWQRRRARFLRLNPVCVGLGVPCGAPATVADHKTRRVMLVRAGIKRPDDDRWLQPLCASCHGRKSSSERG